MPMTRLNLRTAPFTVGVHPGTFVADASDIGLAPGCFPESLDAMTWNGRHVTLRRGAALEDGEGLPFGGFAYQGEDVTLFLFND